MIALNAVAPCKALHPPVWLSVNQQLTGNPSWLSAPAGGVCLSRLSLFARHRNILGYVNPSNIYTSHFVAPRHASHPSLILTLAFIFKITSCQPCINYLSFAGSALRLCSAVLQLLALPPSLNGNELLYHWLISYDHVYPRTTEEVWKVTLITGSALWLDSLP